MPDASSDLVDALAGRYEMDGPVGRGGMATVYGATDLKHGRRVAIKVLRPELSANLGAERFLREIEIAAKLQHPHILMLIDSGQAAETFYYVMPFVEGGSLRTPVDGGPMKLDETVSIIENVADALSFAHQQGVVHRDIKPENILFSRGYPLVADFGIARAVHTAGDQALTRTGFPLGTVGYMSPEQAAGSTDLDRATDVYSLACVTYEMLLGTVPGVWLGDSESDEGRLRDIPAQHRSLLDALPDHIEPALARALARRPGERFQDPLDFAAALNGTTEVKRKYSDREVGAIIKHAAESQFRNPTSDGNLTVGAIEAIAADVGLSPERIRRAIMEIDEGPVDVSEPDVSAVTKRIELETTIKGEVPQAELGVLLDEIRVQLHDVGIVHETMGTSLSWQNKGFEGAGGSLRINVRPKRGETTISINESTFVYRARALALSAAGGGALMALMVAIGEIESISAASALGKAMIGVTVAALPVSLMTGRYHLRRFLKKRREKLAKLLKRLVGVSQEAVRTEGGEDT